MVRDEILYRELVKTDQGFGNWMRRRKESVWDIEIFSNFATKYVGDGWSQPSIEKAIRKPRETSSYNPTAVVKVHPACTRRLSACSTPRA